MPSKRFFTPLFFSQSGSALILSLVFLLLLTILGVAAMQSATLQERMAGNTRDRNVAFQAAEASLRGAEDKLSDAVLPPFNNSTAGFIPLGALSGNAKYWLETYKWADPAGTNSGSQKYLTHTLSGVAAPPRYVIEELPKTVGVGESIKLKPMEKSGYYRVTTRAVGATQDTTIILQSVYKR